MEQGDVLLDQVSVRCDAQLAKRWSPSDMDRWRAGLKSQDYPGNSHKDRNIPNTPGLANNEAEDIKV